MAGLVVQGLQIQPEAYWWIVIAIAGGALGSWVGSTKVSSQTLKHMLRVVLVIAGVKLMFF